MSDSEREEEQDIFDNQEDLEKFFQTSDCDWMPNHSNEVTSSVAEYNHLFANLNKTHLERKTNACKPPLPSKQMSLQNLATNRERELNQQIANWKHQKHEEESKKRLTNKIQEILARRNQQPTKSTPQAFNSSLPSKAAAGKRTKDNPRGKKIRRRAVVTREIIEKAKIAFQYYNASADKPPGQRITFKQIAERLGVCLTEITNLYDEYTQDPLFTNRLKKIEQAQKYTIGPPGTQSHALNAQRLKFITELVRLNSGISEREIVKRVNEQESLLQRDSKGEKIPINRKIVHTLVKMGNLGSKKVLPPPQRNINSPQFIGYRYKYVRRYLELTEDINSDIYFLGQYSFANLASLSSCSSTRKSTFVDYLQLEKSGYQNQQAKDMKRQIADSKQKGEDPWGRNLQYLVVMSLQGLLYYEIFNNIFKEIDFAQTLDNIGRTIALRNPHKKKYLILQTSFFHPKDDLHTLEKTFPLKVIFLPPQTPMLNPTEYLFNEIKALTRSKVYKSKRSYADVLLETLELYRERNLKSLYCCIGPYVELALKQLPFK